VYIRAALTSRERVIRVVGFLFAGLATVQVVRLTVFSVDPSRTGAAVYPFDQFYVQHSCLSAYFQAAKLGQARVPNLYDETLYAGSLDRFHIDPYLYPPQFLLLPASLLGITADFYRFRIFWFVFDLVLFLAATLVVARWIGGLHGRTVLMLTGLLIAAVPTAMTLQIGNFQIVGFALAMLAMVLIESDFLVFGTALLAFAAASKLFPGILVVWLAFQRRWRAVVWVFAWNVVLLLATALWFGTDKSVFSIRNASVVFPSTRSDRHCDDAVRRENCGAELRRHLGCSQVESLGLDQSRFRSVPDGSTGLPSSFDWAGCAIARCIFCAVGGRRRFVPIAPSTDLARAAQSGKLPESLRAGRKRRYRHTVVADSGRPGDSSHLVERHGARARLARAQCRRAVRTGPTRGRTGDTNNRSISCSIDSHHRERSRVVDRERPQFWR